jgi:hypothetical protein
MALSPPKPRLVESIWGGKCSGCGLKIEKGTQCWFTPAFLTRKSAIRHLDGECGTMYVVDVVYRASRQSYKTPAFSAEEALEKVIPQIQRKLRVGPERVDAPIPEEYQVRQGNIVLLRRSHG